MNLKHSGLAIGYYIWLNQFLDTTGHCSQQSSVSSPEAEGTIALLQKCHLFLEQQPRKTLCLSLTGIDSLFYLETGKLVMTALKILEVSSYFMSLCKITSAF